MCRCHIFNVLMSRQLPVFFSVVLLVLANNVFAQDFEAEFDEFQKSIQKEFHDFQDSSEKGFSEFVDSINVGFNQMLEEADEEFASILGKEWKQYNLFQDKYIKGEKEPDFQSSYQQEPVLNKQIGNFQNQVVKTSKARVVSPYLFYENKDQSKLYNLSYKFYQTPLLLQYHEYYWF